MKLKDEALLELSAAELNLVGGGRKGWGERISNWSKNREEIHKAVDNFLDNGTCSANTLDWLKEGRELFNEYLGRQDRSKN